MMLHLNEALIWLEELGWVSTYMIYNVIHSAIEQGELAADEFQIAHLYPCEKKEENETEAALSP
jgi:hypothetical protein